MSLLIDSTRPGLSFHAEAIRSGLAPVQLGGLVELAGRAWRVVVVEQGGLILDRDTGRETLEGPAVLWLADGDALRVAARPGSVVGYLTLSETTLINAIGHKPEAVDLRLLAARSFRVMLSEDDALCGDVLRAFDAILRETHGRAPGFETVTEAQIRVLLVLLWRNTTRPDELRGASAVSSAILQTFRQLVETHFRDRWTVARYASEMGVSPDRLHRICTRVLGTPPLRLIQARTAQEAEILLERSNRTLDQIAAYLGFRSTPQFSAFFKAETGHPPGAWRKAVRAVGRAQAGVQKRSYADWQ
jgi:AraC family transcriptional activator of pobA